MGKRRISRRKPILQIDKGKKSEGSRVSSTSGVSNVEYSQTESGTGTTITIKTTAQSQESEASGGQGQKSEEQMDSEIANFLKEISALGSGQEGEEGEVSTTESSSNETADQSGASQDESEATQQVQQDANRSDQLQGQSGAGKTVVEDAGEGAAGETETKKEETEPTVTFWQSVIDPNTNHAYYWNPATNEVCWTLPENGVISDEPLPEKGEKAGTSKGAGPSSYADYYAYYAQAYYGVNSDQRKPTEQSKQQGAAMPQKVTSVPPVTTQSGASVTVASTETGKEPQKADKIPKGPLVTSAGKPEGESVQSHVPVPILDAKQEGFVGPTLPTAAAVDTTMCSTDVVAMEIGGKQDSKGEGESRGASNGMKDEGKGPALPETRQAAGAQESRSVAAAAGNGQKSDESVAIQTGLQRQPLQTGQKRKAPDTDDEESPLVAAGPMDGEVLRGPGANKKPRRNPLSPDRNTPKKKVQVSASPAGVASKQAEQAVRLQVSMLADGLTRKLQYLHVSNEGVADLQVLNIQLQTRLADWKDGGLSSKFLLGRFKQITKDLQLYEDQAAPEGWSCVWDSASCRYQFRNTATGESSWEYPLQAILSPGSVEPQSSEISNQEETEASDQDAMAEGGREREEEGTTAAEKRGERDAVVGEREGDSAVAAEEGGERGDGGEQREEEDEAQTDEGSQQLLDQEMEEVSDGDFSSEPEDQSAEGQLPPSQPAPTPEPQPAKVAPPSPPEQLQQREHQVEALEKVLTFLGSATPEQQQQLFSQTQLTPEQRQQMLDRARAMKQQKEQEEQEQQKLQAPAPKAQQPPPPPPTQQYRGPTAEYFYSAPEVTVTHGKNQHSDSRPLQEVPPTQKGAGLGEEDTPEERELSVEEVRQKLQRSRRPLVSYDKEEPGDIPEDEEQGTDEADVDEEEERQENQPETGMEFISEFPPKGFPPRKPPKRKPRKQAPPTEGAHTTPPAPEEALKSDVSPSVSVEERKKPPASVSMEERKKLSTSEVRFKVDSLTEIKARMTQPISEPSVPSVSGAQASNVETANTGGVLSLRSGSGDETSLQSQAAKLEEKFRGLSSPPPEQLPTGQIVFSRDPRVAKRQQQLLQQVSVGDPEEKAEEEKASPPAEDGQDDGGEENEARMRERLLRRAKYRIRKASDKKGARQSKEMVERPTSGAGDSVEESTGIVEPSSKEKSFSPDLIELEDVSAQPSPSASDDVFGGGGAVGDGDSDGGAGEGEGRVVVEPETGETEAVLGGQSNAGESSEKREPPPRVTQGRTGGHQSPRATGERSQTEEEGEILSSSPLPDHRLLPTTGRCYMDMEGYEGRSGGREVQRTDRFEGSGKYDDSYSRRSPEDYNRREDSYRSGARQQQQQQQQQQQRSRSRSHSWSRSPDAGHRRSTKSSQQHRRDDSDYSDRYYSDEEYRKRHSDDEYKYRSSGGKSKKYQKSRKHHRYDDYSDYSDVSDEYYRGRHRSSSSRRSGSRRQYNRDDVSDYSDYDDRRDRDRDESFSKSRSKRSTREEEKSSSKKKRKHRSRSRSKDSKDSRERDRDKEKSKKKKKDKKDRKKKHHRKDGSGDESKTPAKPPPNVLVGKVGKVGSFRTLGQKKSLSSGEEAAKGAITGDTPATQSGEKTQVVAGTTNAQKSAETPSTQQQTQPPTQQQSLPGQQQAAGPYYQQQPYYPQATYPGYDTSGYDYQQQQQPQAWQWGDQAYGEGQYAAGAPYSGDQYSQGYAQQGSGTQYGEGYVQGDQMPQAQASEVPQQMEGVESGQQASGAVVSGQQTIELEEEEAIVECEMEIEDDASEKSPEQKTDTAASNIENQTPESAPSDQANATSIEESSAAATGLKASEVQLNVLQTSDVSMEGQSAADTSAVVVEAVETGEATGAEIAAPPETEAAQQAVTVTNESPPPALQEPPVEPPRLPNENDTEQPPPPESDQMEAQTETSEAVPAPAPEPLQEEKSESTEPLATTGMEPVDEPLPPGIETLPNPVPREEAAVPIPPPQPPIDAVEENQSPTGTKPEPGAGSEPIPPPPPLPETEAEGNNADAGGHSTPPPPGTEPEPSLPPPPPPPGTGTGELAVEVPVGEDAYRVPSDDETGAAATTTAAKENGDAQTAPPPQETTPESQADQTGQTSQTSQATPTQGSVGTPAEPAQPVATISTSETTGYAYEGQPQISSSSYEYQTTSAAEVAPTSYDYSAYSQSPVAAPQGYDYSAYTAQAQAQAGYNYAYSAYLQQQAAASYSGYTLASDGQYYPTAAYGGYAGVGGGNPYAGYYGGGGMYGTTPGYQVAQQQAAAAASPQQNINVAQPLSEDKKEKKSEFALAGNKEKQVKSMMEKWSSFKGP